MSVNMASLTLVGPLNYRASTCGYCSEVPGRRSVKRGSKSYGLFSSKMTPEFYQHLIDNGWRRSGQYVYHPDMARTCCPQYTIRLDAAAFSPTKHHRGVVNRWNRFLSTGQKPGDPAVEAEAPTGKVKNRKNKNRPFDLVAELRAHQVGYMNEEAEPSAHRLELVLTPAEATDETFELFRKYQIGVHKEAESKPTRAGFSNFLCQSPLGDRVTIPYAAGASSAHLPRTYGSYHLLYRVDSVLVGISVIDILPACVSSVYFIWDPKWAWASLGKVSALYEIVLVREMAAAGAPGMGYLYMGYWIANCVKMRYKGEYAPSALLDPGTGAWHALTPHLDRYLQAHGGYTPFADVEALATGGAGGPMKRGGAGGGAPEGSTKKPKVGGDDRPDSDSLADGGGRDDGSESGDDGDEGSDDDSDVDSDWPTPIPPGMHMNPTAVSTRLMRSVLLLWEDHNGPVGIVKYTPSIQRCLTPAGQLGCQATVAALGTDALATAPLAGPEDLARKALLHFG